jgi:hypothetical protein
MIVIYDFYFDGEYFNLHGCNILYTYNILIFNLFTIYTVTPVGVDHAARLFAKKAISVCSSAGIALSLSEEYMRSLFEKTSSACEVSYKNNEENKRYQYILKEIHWIYLHYIEENSV